MAAGTRVKPPKRGYQMSLHEDVIRALELEKIDGRSGRSASEVVERLVRKHLKHRFGPSGAPAPN